LATYQRSLNSANSPFDQWYFGHNEKAVTDHVKRGFKLFAGKANCIACHIISKNSAIFTDHKLHNTGHGYSVSFNIRPKKQQLLVAPGQYIEIDSDLFDSVSEKKQNDLGLYEITEDPADRWKYKTPTLRNISLTAPYMHDGGFKTLEGVIDFYNQGGIENEELDPLIKPLSLTDSEKYNLLAFLNSLTGSNVNELIADGFAAPVGDTHN